MAETIGVRHWYETEHLPFDTHLGGRAAHERLELRLPRQRARNGDRRGREPAHRDRDQDAAGALIDHLGSAFSRPACTRP